MPLRSVPRKLKPYIRSCFPQVLVHKQIYGYVQRVDKSSGVAQRVGKSRAEWSNG